MLCKPVSTLLCVDERMMAEFHLESFLKFVVVKTMKLQLYQSSLDDGKTMLLKFHRFNIVFCFFFDSSHSTMQWKSDK